MLTHQIPATPAYLRIKIGRRLARVGALALKGSVYALPAADTKGRLGAGQCAAASYGFHAQYVRYKPGLSLDAFVDDLWLLSDAPAHAKEHAGERWPEEGTTPAS